MGAGQNGVSAQVSSGFMHAHNSEGVSKPAEGKEVSSQKFIVCGKKG